MASSSATSVSTPSTSRSSPHPLAYGDPHISRDVAVGCLHFNTDSPITTPRTSPLPDWVELFSDLPGEVQLIIGNEAEIMRLLDARWIRMFLHRSETTAEPFHSIVRVYVLPVDWGRRFLDPNSRKLKLDLRHLLHKIDISPVAWHGDYVESAITYFDPWATAENFSLYYLFNKLPSPAPTPDRIKSRYTRVAVKELLDSVLPPSPEGPAEEAYEGLKTRLYPYQARSASLMIQREAAPQLQLDPRLETRRSPDGTYFFFDARGLSFLQEPRFYETNRGGILAETMGLGKTIICLAVILATRGHLPRIPGAFLPSPVIRHRVGSLADMTASIMNRYSIPAKVQLERFEKFDNIDLRTLKKSLERNVTHYDIPPELPRMNRATKITPPRRLVMCSGTIVVVPRNLLQQWRLEIQKHVVQGSLKILVVDSTPKRNAKTKATPVDPETEFTSELPSARELMNFSSAGSNAVLVAKDLQAERRWVVSGTPAKNLRKPFRLDDEETKAAKALGSLASNFLMVRPWSDSTAEGRLDWDEYIFRHENQHRKTYSGFSTCFLRTLGGLVVKTRPEDVDKDITLPPMKHRVVYLKPCWFDKMTANLFIQVLRANAITSERQDTDYLFHKNSVKARHSLIRNLRQSNFTWTGFSLEDIASTLETSAKYLGKEDKSCSLDDASSLLESSSAVAQLMASDAWKALSKAHEVGMAVEDWPKETEEIFSFTYPTKPSMVGVTQLLEGQGHVDSRLRTEDPTQDLALVGQAARAKVEAIETAETATKETTEKASSVDVRSNKTGVPSSCVSGQPLTSRRAPAMNTQASPQKSNPANSKSASTVEPVDLSDLAPASVASISRSKKRKITLDDEMAELPQGSPLQHTRVVGTTSAKLSYLVDKVIKHYVEEKIIIFYDGDNAAFYIAQCLEMLYIDHRIYARTLENTKRSEYVTLFNEDPDIRVLLIDVACGALGLNLNVASVVLIVNPINRPGIEAQAIKRAHRIGQTREVLVETLVLEGTMEEAIFKHAKKMSRNQHIEAKELEDDAGIVSIIQNAKVLPIEPEEAKGLAQFAALKTPQQVFGRPNRHNYHRYGIVDASSSEKAPKKPRTAKKAAKNGTTVEDASVTGSPAGTLLESQIPILPPPVPPKAQHQGTALISPPSSGLGGASRGSLFG
ncbi:hypothetical protein BDV95DRAFT_377353 [Massariosphaeria phaeospora]|uniref:Helicase C-terminal domain-containing protein n=1 Tax=Massariosphaeria phaeospora TaxID=100035 RepID=A0A7C8MAI0_9PLEO|nr:hypothetical protein BDV95DRAFT_377353 [Massariosphaeria phaeospora]